MKKTTEKKEKKTLTRKKQSFRESLDRNDSCLNIEKDIL